MAQTTETPARTPGAGRSAPRVHRAWSVAAVTFVTIIGAAAFASLPGLLIEPLHAELHWSRGTIGFAISVNLALYGLTAPSPPRSWTASASAGSSPSPSPSSRSARSSPWG